jgi:molecular chaperone GrpE
VTNGRDGNDDSGQDDPKLPPNPELEEALREAVESVEGHEQGATSSEELEKQLAASQERLIRLQADFENFRRRALAERHDIYQYGHENLVKDLLLTVDNLDRAIGHARESEGGDLESFLQGIELVQREFLGILEKHAVKEVKAQGEMFDPAVHEAMAQVPDGKVPPNTVKEVLQKGYQLRDRLLRPARVLVAKAPEGEPERPAQAGQRRNGEAAD